MSIKRSQFSDISTQAIDLPTEIGIPEISEAQGFLNADADSIEKFQLMPMIVTDLEAGLALSVDESSLYFPSDKDYDGGTKSVDGPAFLLIKNKNTGNLVAATNKFLITNWQETRVERLQVLETFHSSTLNWFDEKTRNYSFNGILLEAERAIPLLTKDVDEVAHTYLWSQSFRKLWDDHLRGSKLVEAQNICVLSMMNNVMFGYPHAIAFSTSAQNTDVVAFQFQFICTKQNTLGSKLSHNYSPDTFNYLQQLDDNPALYEQYLSTRIDLDNAVTNNLGIAEARQRWETAANNIINNKLSNLIDNDLGLDG